MLPQTNEKRAAWLVVLGTIIVSGVAVSIFKKQ
ncbi:LPXTG cell wall anchor domain-containing protein [Enterococcus sp. DIV1767]